MKAGDREEVARGEGGKVSSGNQVQVPKSAELTREEEGNSGNSCFERVSYVSCFGVGLLEGRVRKWAYS